MLQYFLVGEADEPLTRWEESKGGSFLFLLPPPEDVGKHTHGAGTVSQLSDDADYFLSPLGRFKKKKHSFASAAGDRKHGGAFFGSFILLHWPRAWT